MATWLEQFANQLAATNATRANSIRRAPDAQSAIYDILKARVDDAEIGKIDYAQRAAHESLGKRALGDIVSGGGHILDVLSRLNYASANFQKQSVADDKKRKASGHSDAFGIQSLADLPGEFAAGWKGFTGKEKTTYSDVLRDSGVKNKYVAGFGGFAGDVLLDPTTYVGAGAVKSLINGGLRGGGKVLGKEAVQIPDKILPKFGRSKNLLRTETVLTPVEKAAAETATDGTTKVMDEGSNVKKILDALHGPSSLPKLPFNVVEDTAPKAAKAASDIVPMEPPSTMLQLESAASKPTFIADASGKVEYKPWSRGTARLAAEANLNSLTAKRAALLKGVEARRYAKDLKIDPLHKTVKSMVPEKYMETVTETLPKAATDDVIKEGLVGLHKMAVKGPGASVKIFGKDGKPLAKKLDAGMPSEADFAKLPEAEQQRIAAEYAQKMRDAKPGGVYSSVKLESLHRMVANGGKLIPEINDAHVMVGKKLVPLQKFVKDIHSNAVDHELFAEAPTVTKQIEATREVEKVISERLTPTETLAWSLKHSDILDPEDMLAIRRAVGLGPKSVETIMNKIREKVVPRDFNSVEELHAARKAGLLTAKGEAALKFRMSELGVRNLPAVDKKIEAAAKAARIAAENPTKVNKVKAAKAAAEATAAKDATAASKTVTKGPDAIDEIWTTPAVQQDVVSKIEKATNGDTSAFVKPKVDLHPAQAAIVTDALKGVNQSEFVDPLTRSKYGFETNRGVKRTRPTPGAGQGRAHRGFNKYSQMNLGKKIISGASRLVRGTDKAARPAAMYDTAMPMLLAAEQTLRANGIPLILGKGATGLPLSMHDVLSALPRGFVEKYYFTAERSLGITQLADITEQFVMMHLGNMDRASVWYNTAKLLSEGMGKKGLMSPLTKHLTSAAHNVNMMRVDDTVKEFMDAFTEAGPKIVDALTSNSAAAVIKVGEETKALTDEVINAFNAVVTDPKFSSADIMRTALNTKAAVKAAGAGRAIPVSGEAEALAEQAAAAHVAETLPMAAIKTVERGADSFARATTTSETARVATKLADSADVEADHLMREMQINTFDLGAKAEFGLGVGFFRSFAGHLGNEMLRPILTERMSVAQSLAKQFTVQLARVHATHTPADIKEAFKLLQEGREVSTPAMQDVQRVIKEMFGDGQDNLGLISRNGISADHLHDWFKRKGIGDVFRLDPKNIDASWKAWNVEDPLDLLSRFHAATAGAVAERQLGADITRMFGANAPQAGSTKWVKVVDPNGKSKLASLIDKEKFYPEDVVRQMHMIDKTLKEFEKPSASNPFLRTVDSAMHAYKAGVTIYRPGHHVRNMIGDVWLSSMDGVSASAYKRATAVLGTRPSQYKDFDALAALQDAYSVSGSAPKSVLNLTYKGKKIALSPDEVYRIAFDSAVLPDYSVLEDIAFGATQQADKVAETMKKISPLNLIGQGGKIHKAATAASEYRDHYVRIAHFIHAMEDGGALKGATLEDALKNAAHVAGSRVRKWHPDGSDLTQVEKSVMRRTVLFYSWVRKAIPLVVETAVSKPGRVMLYPKVMQNIAAMNGIDLNGYGNPFPTDQLFPSYIADSTQGPIAGQAGSYVGIKPGIPSMDVMDDYASSPLATLRTIMGGTNPMLKVPAEIASGNQLRTGTPIMDKTDYIDQQIPGASYINKLAGGRSLSSGFTQSTRVSPSNAGYAGNPNTPGLGGTDFLNWLLGLGITDYSKPSSIKSAQREQGSN